MTQIDTKGMQAAELNEAQLEKLKQAEKEINNGADKEVYLLAVQRSS